MQSQNVFGVKHTCVWRIFTANVSFMFLVNTNYYDESETLVSLFLLVSAFERTKHNVSKFAPMKIFFL